VRGYVYCEEHQAIAVKREIILAISCEAENNDSSSELKTPKDKKERWSDFQNVVPTCVHFGTNARVSELAL